MLVFTFEKKNQLLKIDWLGQGHGLKVKVINLWLIFEVKHIYCAYVDIWFGITM